MAITHSTMTGDNVHEPKGIENATAGQVYISDGVGSGTWTDTASTVGLSNFSTGDVKLTLKTSADIGWVLMNDGSIGNTSSGATSRANADTEDLYTLIWNGIDNTWAPVASGRGVSAAADFAANKAMTLPRVLGRALAAAGSGSGLTARTLGSYVGNETHSLSEAELASHAHGFQGTPATFELNQTGIPFNCSFAGYEGAGAASIALVGGIGTPSVTVTAAGTVASNGSGTGHNNVQPTSFLNVMVKL